MLSGNKSFLPRKDELTEIKSPHGAAHKFNKEQQW